MTDVFPALVSVYRAADISDQKPPYPLLGLSDKGATKFSEVRVIVQKNFLLVGSDGPRGPFTAYQAEPVEVFKDATYTRVLTTSGDVVVFARSKGCGCGSRLRSWNPYGKVVRSG